MGSESTHITIAHSPDADDAFMFYGLATGKVGTPGIRYEHMLKDIQTLNEWAMEGRHHVTAFSVHAYAYLTDKYLLLRSGASMGEKDYGPIVVAREPYPVAELKRRTIAIPGKLTTAALVLQLALPGVRTIIMPFDAILPAVAEGEVEAGLLIHEGQLTYAAAGLHNCLSLGAWWHERHGLPLPLGANGIRRDINLALRRQIAGDIRASIDYALAHRDEALTHCRQFARDLPTNLLDRFVGMYVNRRTQTMQGEEEQAIRTLLAEGANCDLLPIKIAIEFA
ncbi:MAG: ABC transporter substrate-binding protein [Deltaproteobacteria bacterium]|nr:ABC transporter substrate-binding protein [Deltaproteobacteria bacterium]